MRSLSFMFLCSLSFLFSETFYVNENGVDNASCSQTQPCLHIQTAIDLTMDGDVVMISPGTYVENILIETAITVQGSDPLIPAIIDGSSPDPTSPNDWNESCVVIKTPRGRTSRISATLQDVKVTGGKGTMVIVDGNKDGDFDDVEDVSKKVGGGIIISNANMTARRLQVVNNGDASTKEGGGIYAAGTGAGVPDNNPNFPPLPGDDERSSIVFEESVFSGNDALVGNTVMVNGWDPENQFIDMDFGNAQFDVAYDDNNNEFDGVTEYWVKGKDNSTFDFTGGITGEYDAIATDVWVDPLNGVDEENSLGDQNNPFLTIDYAMGMIYPTEDNPVTIHLTEGTFSPSINGEIFPIIMFSNINIVGSSEERTILDAINTNRIIIIDSNINNQISNLTIFRGETFFEMNDADNPLYSEYGCSGPAIYVTNADPVLTQITIKDCRSECEADGGGGIIVLAQSNANLSNMTIKENLGYGIVMVKSEPTIINTIIRDNSGGGIFIDGLASQNGETYDPIMSYMIIENNFPRWYGNGQGIESHWSNFSLTNSNIEGNIGNQAGGGMRLYNSNPIITDVQIDDNTALDGDCFGGGIHMESSNPIFTNVTINNNMAQSENGECMGGGVWAESSAPVFINVEICNNQAWTRGGGIVLQGQGLSEGPRPILNNVIISGNISRQGGGILLEDSGPIFNNVIISNNAAEGYHDGSAIYCDAICSPILNNATITNNYVTSEENGVALVLKSFEDAPILITNSIIWNDGISEIYINDWDEEESFVYVMYSDIQYGWEGEGNIDSDPLLNDDFTLQANSPCIDAGTADLDGDGQNDITDYYGEAPDIGAFEFEGSTTIPGDVNGDGLLNILDVVALVNIVLGYADPVDSGDLNGDGSLNVLDVVALVEIILNP